MESVFGLIQQDKISIICFYTPVHRTSFILYSLKKLCVFFDNLWF